MAITAELSDLTYLYVFCTLIWEFHGSSSTLVAWIATIICMFASSIHTKQVHEQFGAMCSTILDASFCKIRKSRICCLQNGPDCVLLFGLLCCLQIEFSCFLPAK